MVGRNPPGAPILFPGPGYIEVSKGEHTIFHLTPGVEVTNQKIENQQFSGCWKIQDPGPWAPQGSGIHDCLPWLGWLGWLACCALAWLGLAWACLACLTLAWSSNNNQSPSPPGGGRAAAIVAGPGQGKAGETGPGQTKPRQGTTGKPAKPSLAWLAWRPGWPGWLAGRLAEGWNFGSVSYTHLTLPTILLV